MRVNGAVVVALAPVCADKFQRAGEAMANLAALKKVDTWSQGEFVEKGAHIRLLSRLSTGRAAAPWALALGSHGQEIAATMGGDSSVPTTARANR
jgi:hypothetical protein